MSGTISPGADSHVELVSSWKHGRDDGTPHDQSGSTPQVGDGVVLGQAEGAQAAAFTLDNAPDHGVVAGPNQLLVAVAHPSCLHSGGQPVVSGSSSIFVGPEQAPLAGHGDRTA